MARVTAADLTIPTFSPYSKDPYTGGFLVPHGTIIQGVEIVEGHSYGEYVWEVNFKNGTWFYTDYPYSSNVFCQDCPGCEFAHNEGSPSMKFGFQSKSAVDPPTT